MDVLRYCKPFWFQDRVDPIMNWYKIAGGFGVQTSELETKSYNNPVTVEPEMYVNNPFQLKEFVIFHHGMVT